MKASKLCLTDHLDYCEDFCPECGELIDDYGNTADKLEYCAYPDCGCDTSFGCPNGGKRRDD